MSKHSWSHLISVFQRIGAASSDLRASLIGVIFVSTLVWPASAQTHLKLESDRFETFASEVSRVIGKIPKDRVLLVYDIDNTLLTMKQDLGGDAWFTWQEDLLKKSPASPDLVAADFSGLLEWQGVFFTLAKMIPTEPKAVEIFNQLKGDGLETMILTSRGPEFRSQTERELKRNGFQIGPMRSLPQEPVTSFLSYEAAGTTRFPPTELQRLKVASARPITFQKGIMMTSGQHKGVMLGTFLEKYQIDDDFDAIVFIDDHAKHTDRVHDAMAAHVRELVTIRYSKLDPQVANFARNPQNAKRDWQDVRVLQQVLFE
jgi:hypothetical protein